MKRMLSTLFVFLLLLGLCGCGSDAENHPVDANGETVLSNPDSPDTSGESGQQVGEIEYDLAVQMTIPAAFTVYLDDAMNIVSVEAGDGDAENLFAQADVAGKPYDEGMGLVLNTALEQGILADQGKVYFTLPCEAISMSLMESLFAPVMQFEKDNGIYVFIDWDVIPEEEPEYEPNHFEKSIYLQEIEEGGQTIYMDKAEWIHPTAGKQIVYCYYSEFPNPMVYEYTPILQGGTLDTIRIKMLYFNEDGSTSVTYFKDGLSVKTVGINEGELEVLEYENGEIAGDVLKNEDGSYSFAEWAGIDEDGYYIPTKSISCWEDGTQAVYTFHSNGNVATSETFGSDGSSSQRTYDENGNELYCHNINQYADGTYSEYESENGRIVYTKEVKSDGTQVELKFENNQPVYEKTVSPDGTQVELKFENYQPVYEKTVSPDGTYQEGHCENGIWTWTEGTIEPTEPES